MSLSLNSTFGDKADLTNHRKSSKPRKKNQKEGNSKLHFVFVRHIRLKSKEYLHNPRIHTSLFITMNLMNLFQLQKGSYASLPLSALTFMSYPFIQSHLRIEEHQFSNISCYVLFRITRQFIQHEYSYGSSPIGKP